MSGENWETQSDESVLVAESVWGAREWWASTAVTMALRVAWLSTGRGGSGVAAARGEMGLASGKTGTGGVTDGSCEMAEIRDRDGEGGAMGGTSVDMAGVSGEEAVRSTTGSSRESEGGR